MKYQEAYKKLIKEARAEIKEMALKAGKPLYIHYPPPNWQRLYIVIKNNRVMVKYVFLKKHTLRDRKPEFGRLYDHQVLYIADTLKKKRK